MSSRRVGTANNSGSYDTRLTYDNKLTFASAVYCDGAEPVVSDEVPWLGAILQVLPRVRVDVPFGEAKVDHVDGSLIGMQTDHTVPELDITVEDASVVHELEPGYLARSVSV